MRGLGQIASLASLAQPDVGVITNIGPVHLELVETIENVARAKAELIDALPARRQSPSCPRSRCSSRTSRATTSRSCASISRVSFRSRRATRAAHQLANTRTALTVVEALGAAAAGRRAAGRVLEAARGGAAASRRRAAAERLLQREPRLDARRARAPRRARRRAPAPRRARRDGRARRRRARPTTPRSASSCASIGVQVIAVGELARAYGGEWVATAERGGRSPARRAAARRRRAREGLALGGTRGRRGESQRADGQSSRRSPRRNDHLDPQRPDLHRLPAAKRVRPADPRGRPRSTMSASRARRRWAGC